MTDDDHDDQLMDELRRLGAAADPVPADVLLAARSAIAYRRMDAELAALTDDSLMASASTGMRGTGTDERLLTFRTGDREVEVEVTPRGAGRVIVGQVVPTEQAYVTVRTPGGQDGIDTDEIGRFSVEVTAGPFSLQITWPDGSKVETEWVAL